MRSDFYSLPYAAQRAIRHGEHEAALARRRAWTISELQDEVARLTKELAAANKIIADTALDRIKDQSHGL